MLAARYAAKRLAALERALQRAFPLRVSGRDGRLGAC